MSNRPRIRFVLLSLAVLGVLVGAAVVSATVGAAPPEADSLYKHLSVFSEALSLVRQAYVDEPMPDHLLAGAFEGATDALGPFATYVPPGEVKDFLASRGAARRQTGLVLLRERGFVYVAGVVEGSAADEAGLQRGDFLAEVGGRPTKALNVWHIENLIAASTGEAVELDVLRQGERISVTLPLGDFAVEPVVTSEARGVPVLRVRRFDPGAVERVRRELSRLAASGKERLVVDLREVAGGEPAIAYQVADLFVDGPLGSLVRRGEAIETFGDREPAAWKGRMVVLTDGGTLGAAEILAKVLDEAAEATLVGDDTFGHAGREDLVSLSSGGLLRVTNAFYAGPDAEPIATAIEPDLLVRESSRRLRERDLSYEELILERGVGVLLGEEPVEAAAAA